MSKSLRLLIIEDSENDAYLVRRELEKGDFALELLRVDSASALKEAIRQDYWDIIISDYVIPGFSGIEALRIVRECGLDVPFIIVSGSAGEEVSVNAMKAGANDYLMKGNLARLVPAIERELRDSKIRQRERAADRQLRESESRLAGIIDSAMDAIISVDGKDKIILFNAAAERMFNCASEEAMGQPLQTFIPDVVLESDQPSAGTSSSAVHSSGNTGRLNQGRGVRKGGAEFPIEATISKVDTVSGEVYTAIVRDVSEKKSLEAQLLQSQKMEAIGQLASGIAHDFNNILGSILGYAELVQMSVEDPIIRKNSETIVKASQRARDLIKKILIFSRQERMQLTEVKLSQVVTEVIELLTASLPASIRLTCSSEVDSDSIMADQTQVHQILVNLATNAAHSMRNKGGSIAFKIESIFISRETFIAGFPIEPGEYIILSVVDTGHGISPENLSRIFEPFFSTKPVNEGTGLGLSVVHGIIKELRGAIEVSSKVGVGTEFKIFFPKFVGHDKIVGSENETTLAAPCNVMLVDDETTLAELSRQLLELTGNKVHVFNDPIEALDFFRQHEASIDLLITDETMPHMNGAELIDQCTRLKPGLGVIVCSGYHHESLEKENVGLFPVEFLAKPYGYEQLNSAVSRTINRVRAGKPS